MTAQPREWWEWEDECNHKGDLVYENDFLQIYAAGERYHPAFTGYDVVISLVGAPIPLRYWGIDLPKPAWISIDNADRTPPPIDRTWLEAFIERMKAMSSKEGRPIRLLVYCLGGHGRTGTFIAGLLKILGVEDPQEYVWNNYCGHAIETEEQDEWVNSL